VLLGELDAGAADGRALDLPVDADLPVDERAGLELLADGAVAAGLERDAPAAGIVATAIADGREWNSSTPMRPTTVAVITIGARFIAPGLC
jgi:hypothetical protein